MKYVCEYCNSEFKNPVSSGHKRKCDAFLAANSRRNVPPCVCGHLSTSLTQMKRHRRDCQAWQSRDSSRIRHDRFVSTLQKTYGDGITNPAQIKEAMDKKAATMKKRYGAENPFSKDSTLFKKVQSHWEGKDRTAHLPKDNFARPEIKRKIIDYWQKTHGVNNGSQVPEIRKKQLETNLRKYGNKQTLSVPEIREKGRETLISRYGVNNAAKSPDISMKIRNTNMERHGVPWTTIGSFREKQYETQILKYGAKFFGSDHGKKSIREALLRSELVPKDGVRQRSGSMNKPEKLIHSLYPSLLYTGNGSYWKYLPSLLGSKNPDFIIPGPDLNRPFKGVGKVVECLGVYWHGPNKTGMQRDDYESHLISCWSEAGIMCLVVWEDETWNDQNLLKEKISSFYHHDTVDKIIPEVNRNLSNVEVCRSPTSDAFSFFCDYHYAGFGRSSVASYVATMDNFPVAYAKFSRPVRQTISTSLGLQDKDVLELDRFCIHPNFHIKNLASLFISKVLKLVKNDFPEILKVVSFADPSEGHGGVIYKASNWTEMGKTSHSYFYKLPSGLKMNKKTLFNKSRSSGLSERDYADSIGAVRVSTPPKIKFVYNMK